MSRIRVLLADDHETVRQGLRLLIDGQHDMQVVAEAGDGRSAIAAAQTTHPDVVVLDISMPDVNGLEAAHLLKDAAPGSAVVTLTRHADDAYVSELLRAGAAGYVLKQSASQELLSAIRAAADGRHYLDSALGEYAGRLSTSRRKTQPAPATTPREAEVLRLMALGESNKEIASALHISVKTVEVHKANAMRKLSLRGRIEVVRYAILQGWLKES
jgi:two-component system, NarL family, response regulator NreC